MKKIAIFNNKGGVAKTTSVINIAYTLHQKGIKVLVVDCDTQENCFSFFTSSMNPDVLSTNFDNIKHTTWTRYNQLNDTENDYQVALFDLPPTISEDVQKIIAHMDVVYVPTMIGEFEISGLKNVTDEIHKQGTRLGGVFITKYYAETDAELTVQLREILKDRMMDIVIPYSNTVRKSQMEGMALSEYFEAHNVPRIGNAWKIVNAYEALTDEILSKVINYDK